MRLTVALGVAIGVSLGAFLIGTGTPLHFYIAAGYVIMVFQTIYANKDLFPLPYDSGGVTTSTVTVSFVTALGLCLASTITGRNTVIDEFGVIAFDSLCQSVSDDVGFGVRADFQLAPTAPPAFGERIMR